MNATRSGRVSRHFFPPMWRKRASMRRSVNVRAGALPAGTSNARDQLLALNVALEAVPCDGALRRAAGWWMEGPYADFVGDCRFNVVGAACEERIVAHEAERDQQRFCAGTRIRPRGRIVQVRRVVQVDLPDAAGHDDARGDPLCATLCARTSYCKRCTTTAGRRGAAPPEIVDHEVGPLAHRIGTPLCAGQFSRAAHLARGSCRKSPATGILIEVIQAVLPSAFQHLKRVTSRA